MTVEFNCRQFRVVNLKLKKLKEKTSKNILLFFHVFQKICEKPQIVNDYEAGRGIPNNVILGKMERVIGLKLRGKERGHPLTPPTKK